MLPFLLFIGIEDLDEFLKASLSGVKSLSDYLIEERLLKALIFLILPDLSATEKTNSVKRPSKDSQVYRWLDGIRGNKENRQSYGSDLLYLLCWTARRALSYNSALKHAETGIRQYPDDPRFYHGFALAKFCSIANDNRKTAADIDNVIRNIDKADALYEKFFEAYYPPDDAEIYANNIKDCIDNSFCFFLTEKAALLYDENEELSFNELARARKRLNMLKTSGSYRDQFCEYYDTEAYLENWESYFEEDFVPGTKLDHAFKAINTAIRLCINKDMVQKYSIRKELISNRLQKFRNV